MLTATQFYTEPVEIDARLQVMGLESQPFVKAAEMSFGAYADCTENDPPTFPGTAAWAAANRSLREDLFAAGWDRKNETNQPLVRNAENTIAITSCSGDKGTGRIHEIPSTRSAKGARTKDYVRINENQLSFDFGDKLPQIEAPIKITGRATWLFLIYRDVGTREMRYELSLPTSMGEDGHVDSWAERIIFPPTTIDTDGVPNGGEYEFGQTPELTVEIRKRDTA